MVRFPSPLEREFQTRWIQLAGDLPEPVREYPVVDDRGYAFDFAWPDYKVAVEMEGGVASGGRHVRLLGFQEDCEKYNLSQLDEWCLLRYESIMFSNDPISCIEKIRRALIMRGYVEDIT